MGTQNTQKGVQMDSLQDSIRRANSVNQRPAPRSQRPVPPLARQFMATDVMTFKPDDPIQRAIDVLVQRGFSGAPVVSDGRVVGVLSELDCMKLLASNSFHQEGAAMSVTVSDLMSPTVITIEPDTDLFAVAHLFIKSGVRRLPVLDGERLVGLVSRPDLLRAIRDFVA